MHGSRVVLTVALRCRGNIRALPPIFEFDTSYREIQASKLDASILPYD
jgi:hypothetical protein